MGGEEAQIPHLDFSGMAIEDSEQEISGEEWKALSSKVREACETHGCFLMKYSSRSSSSSNSPMITSLLLLREKMFMAMDSLFDLPEETKKKYTNPKLYHGYLTHPMVPIYETFAINGASKLEVARAFTDLMWPHHGNSHFCEVLNTMSSKMLELNLIILKMVFESFGMENCYGLHAENNSGTLRMNKYKVPPISDSAAAVGIPSHTDKSFLTILCQNEVQGLELLSKDGNWDQVKIPKESFIVFVGDSLKAWSNGRLHAAKHRVMMSGNKVRYSCGLFLLPNEDVIVEVPQELVDEDHPLRYKPFQFSDFLSFYASNYGDEVLEIYAGV